MTLVVDDLYNKGVRAYLRYVDSESFRTAINLVAHRIRNGGVSLVWGPPGTGKTTTFVNVIKEEFDRILNSSDLILYVAPTNQLVGEMCIRLANVYQMFKLEQEDFLEHVRIYGSQFSYRSEKFSALLKMPSKNTKFILTTAYQVLPIKELNVERIHIMIDEASKSPLHIPFIPLTQEFLNYLTGEEERTSSLNILGDPMQAIGIDELKGRRDLLLFLRVCAGLLNKQVDYDDPLKILTEANKSLSGKYLTTLDTTFRIPSPSEEPISYGFYGGILKANATAKYRLTGLWDEGKARELTTYDEKFKRVTKVLESSLTTGRPLTYLHTTGRHEYSDYIGELFDKKRAQIGLYYATALAYITNEPVSVITTYADQAHHMKNLYNRYFKPLLSTTSSPNVSFMTAHRALGTENEHVVMIIGKEYFGRNIGEETIYFAEPEVFNVQLSRHKKTLVIVGNLQRMYNTINKFHAQYGSKRYMELKVTVSKILELCGAEIEKRELVLKKSDGEGGVIDKWE